MRVVTSSNMAHKSLLATEDLDDEIGLEVVDARTVVPLGIETILKSVRKDDTALAASFLLGVPGAVANVPHVLDPHEVCAERGQQLNSRLGEAVAVVRDTMSPAVTVQQALSHGPSRQISVRPVPRDDW